MSDMTMSLTIDDTADLENITRKSRAVLAVSVAVGAALFVLLALQAAYQLTASAEPDPLDAANTPLNAGIALVGIAFAVMAQIAQIAFAFFAYRTNKNARKVGIQKLVFTPFWAAAINFIPPTQILFPYFVIRETWIASRAFTGKPKATKLLNMWGAAWLLTFVALVGVILVHDTALPLVCALATMSAVYLRRVMADLAEVQLQAFPRAPPVREET